MLSPMVRGLPVITDSISGGRPASYNTSASNKAVNGVNSVGFKTTRLLVAMAGANLWLTMFNGWLNGVMAEITPIKGTRVVKILRCFPFGLISQENVSPSSLMHNCPAKE